MPGQPRDPRRLHTLLRAVIEIAFIIFLFYANLLMGEFNRTNGAGKTLVVALHDIITRETLTIAVIAAFIGYIVFETLRKKL
ncbi:MAG: hypothetical protein ABR910_12705 [Acidobacteriaceae bacterium]|jgi:hypothetical protein